jgi:hypothetical protein
MPLCPSVPAPAGTPVSRLLRTREVAGQTVDLPEFES